MNSKMKGLIWITAVVVLAFYFSDGVSFLVKQISWKYEVKLADRVMGSYHPKICSKNSPSINTILNKFIQRLYPLNGFDDRDEIKLSFIFVENNQVNAYATLGGKIYINSGLLRDIKSSEELAGVIAHEIAHVKERHVLQGVLLKVLTSSGDQSDLFFNLGFSRGQEHVADVKGLERLKFSLISAQGFYEFFERQNKNSNQFLSLLSDHPGDKSRLDLASKYLVNPYSPLLTLDEWHQLQKICD